ncbi:MAG: DUF6152 family protein [Pseudomonadota bacterium]
MFPIRRSGFFFLLLLSTQSASAHHSFAGRFDTRNFTEIEGVVTKVSWRNPHVYIHVDATNADGTVTDWELESGPPTMMLRSGVERDSIKVGDRIRAAGYTPLTGRQEIYATNVQIPTGEELILSIGIQPRWDGVTRGDYSFRSLKEGEASRPELGVFKIWTTTVVNGMLFPENINPAFDLSVYPMTDAARARVANFDRARDNPTNNCTPKGMPMIMEQPYPMEFVQAGSDIHIRLEEYDTLRVIHMNEANAPAGTEPGPLGYSTGVWEGNSLVVTTTHVNWPYFDQVGIPQSADSVLTERFTPGADGSQMDYELTVNDPVNFTAPVTLRKFWLYIPSEQIFPYECEIRADSL